MTNLDLIKNLYVDFANGNIPGVLALLDPSIEWNEAEGFPYGGRFVGPQAVVDNVFMKLATEWENWTAVPDEFVDGGDVIVSMGKYGGTFRETGKSISVPFSHVWTLKDGKAVKFVQFTDTLLVADALS